MSDQIHLVETASGGRYTFCQDNGPLAEMTFSKAGEKLMIIDHTDVPDAYRGKGVGVKLITKAVEDARNAGKKIIPLCPFANAQFHKHPEWRNVWSGHDKD